MTVFVLVLVHVSTKRYWGLIVRDSELRYPGPRTHKGLLLFQGPPETMCTSTVLHFNHKNVEL